MARQPPRPFLTFQTPTGDIAGEYEHCIPKTAPPNISNATGCHAKRCERSVCCLVKSSAGLGIVVYAHLAAASRNATRACEMEPLRRGHWNECRPHLALVQFSQTVSPLFAGSLFGTGSGGLLDTGASCDPSAVRHANTTGRSEKSDPWIALRVSKSHRIRSVHDWIHQFIVWRIARAVTLQMKHFKTVLVASA